MFNVLIDQIEHLNNSSIQSYFVGQICVTNEIIQFSERKLIDKSRCEMSFNTICFSQFHAFSSYESDFYLLRVYLSHQHKSLSDNVCFASAYRTNIDRLPTTPTRSLITYLMKLFNKHLNFSFI